MKQSSELSLLGAQPWIGLVVSLLAAVAFGSPAARAQQQFETPCSSVSVKAWVDPYYGVDPHFGSPLGSQLNDPNTPYKTLQSAIDAVSAQLVVIQPTQTGAQGIVYALPGVYGPNPLGSPPASGDALPIRMRDRVHVQGLGARACIIRGDSSFDPPTPNIIGMFWPDRPNSGTHPDKQVLVDYTDASEYAITAAGQNAPWAGAGDTAEKLDGFTFEGGDVQVRFSTPAGLSYYELSGQISNCVFDMRHDPGALYGPKQDGAYFGIMMVHPWILSSIAGDGGYLDQRVYILNNTFIMAEFVRDAQGGQQEGWLLSPARPGAVAIIDVTDPLCSATSHDPDTSLRGVGRPFIANNLFRTKPSISTEITQSMAMLGIDDSDTRLSSTNPPIDTNVYARDRTGSNTLIPPPPVNYTQQVFFSAPAPTVVQSNPFFIGPVAYPRLYCTSPVPISTNVPCLTTAPPAACPPATRPMTPVVPLWDGHLTATPPERDPGFVGEYLGGILRLPGQPIYRDWRLLPDSPVKDKGYFQSTMQAVNGTTYFEAVCPDLSSFTWDFEWHGNPRVVDGAPDPGCDEIHSMVMAGSWGNDAHSHNLQGFLNPSAPAGKPTRYFILRKEAVGGVLQVNGTLRPATNPPTNAWTQPPATLAVPITDPTFVPGFQTRYINFNNTGTPTPWNFPPLQALILKNYQNPIVANQPQHQFVEVTVSDVEPPPPAESYFNMEGFITHSDLSKRWSNLQSEYR